jgi:hypothetical protein
VKLIKKKTPCGHQMIHGMKEHNDSIKFLKWLWKKSKDMVRQQAKRKYWITLIGKLHYERKCITKKTC